ncbi:Fic family protein [Mucilaginibacter kameinonensis]|uniref:Fic family protein n=1 Tax=Mucilaginibacter kameinonensis TaxID=452286 RepID=UPI000EF7CA1F|nr:Fic family protein [Mucilaginibacter kameinonensis]
MKDLAFEILPIDLLDDYLRQAPQTLLQSFEQLADSELSKGSFSFYTSVSAVFSSKIEGVDIELDSFTKHKMLGVQFLPKYIQKADDLYEAYQFAKKAKLNYHSVQEAHRLLTKHILKEARRGQLRAGNMPVTAADGKDEYITCSPGLIKEKLEMLFSDITLLLKTKLTATEVFFCAAMLHLVFVKIHPFEDGNGRMARLLEKWFIAEKLGPKAWFLQSEKYYYDHHRDYYHNIRLLGLEYDLLDYSAALPFLLMLPDSF